MTEKILVVEDDKIIREGICSALGKRYAVEAVENGEEALNKLKENPFDLVILDYKLPDIDGMEVACRIKGQYPEVPIIFMTAHGNINLVIEALRLGAYDFIEKPFHPEVLIKSVDRCVSMKKLELERARLQVRKVALEIGVPHELEDFASRVSAWIMTLERHLEPDREDIKHILKGFWKTIESLLDVLEKIEHFCGIERNERLSQVDINEIIKEVVSFITVKWKLDAYSKGISYYVSTKLGKVRPVKVNPTDFRDALSGLVISAFKVMPGGGSLLIETGMEDDSVVIKLIDTGAKVPERPRAGLNTDLEDYELGVNLARHIIIGYGGRVSMESSPEKGTIFTIRLPTEKAQTSP